MLSSYDSAGRGGCEFCIRLIVSLIVRSISSTFRSIWVWSGLCCVERIGVTRIKYPVNIEPEKGAVIMINTLAGYAMTQTMMTTSKRSTGTEKTGMSDKAFSDMADEIKNTSERGKVMAEYYARKPEYKSIQEGRVNGGYAVLSSMGMTADDLEEMSPEEFRVFMSGAIQSIPHDVSRPYDEETVLISEDGWENMKKDPDYAAWVLGYLKEDRSVRNPFTAMGDKGSFVVQSFGASPADYHGHGFSKIYGGTASGARSMYNAGKGGMGIVTNASKAHMQPPKDYDIQEEKRKARKKRMKELLEDEMQAKYEYHRRMASFYNSQARARAEMFRYRAGFKDVAAASGETMPSMPTAFFDAEMLLSALM